MKSFKLIMVLSLFIGIVSGCGTTNDENVKTYHRWFSVSDQTSSMLVFNETGEKPYQYNTLRQPTEDEQRQFTTATTDGAAPGINDPNYKKRSKSGKLSEEQIRRLKSLFTEDKVRQYAKGQTDDSVVSCRKSSDSISVTWFIGIETYAACWTEGARDQAEESTKTMLDEVVKLKDSLTAN